MKTQILHLESFDDRHSIIDKLNWGQADQVIIIWPLRGTPLDNKLDLKLIHRRCQTAKMKLALVCKKRQIIDFAQDLGIPVFRSLRQAQRVAWEYTLEPFQEIKKPENRRTRAELEELIQKTAPPKWTQTKQVRVAAFLLSILSVFVLAAFLIPGARIEYLPELETQNLNLTLSASPEFATFNLSGAIPAHRLTVTVEGRDEIESSGQTGVPEDPATGIIIFTNLTDQEINIPSGTIVRTADPNSSIRFATTTQTTIDAEAGLTSRVPIEATNPGPNGNLPANTLVIIDGNLSRSLTATNPDPTSGGNERLSPSPTLADYQALSEQLLDSLWLTALEEAQLTLNENDVILDSSPRKAVILEETYTPEEPQPSPTLSLLLRVEYEILYLQWSDLHEMGNAALDASLPDGYSSQTETLKLQSISPPEFGEAEQIEWDVLLSRQVFTVKKLPGAVSQILGRPPEKAARILRSALDLSNDPQISIFPDWWPVLPLLEARIETIDLRPGS